MENEGDFSAATERINLGAPIPAVEPLRLSICGKCLAVSPKTDPKTLELGLVRYAATSTSAQRASTSMSH